MDRNSDVYNRERLDSYNSPLFDYQNRIVEIVSEYGTDTLWHCLHKILESSSDKKAAQYADFLLAEFIRHGVLDGFREVEVPMRAAYKSVTEVLQKHEEAKLATETAMTAWGAAAEDFRFKLEILGQWAKSTALELKRRRWGREPNPHRLVRIVGTASWLRTPGDFVKYHDSFLREINFIREVSAGEVIEGRREWPVRMSDFESSWQALEAAQELVEALQNEESNAKAAFESANLKYNAEQKKAITVLECLSEAGRWALFCLFKLTAESPEDGEF